MSTSSDSFSTNKGTFGTKEFLESNSLVAKFAFLLLVLLAFVILLRIGISFMFWLLGPNGSPKLINGTVDASQMLIFHQDPSFNDVKYIPRSSNSRDGIEFTWSVWIYINNLQGGSGSGTYQHIFHKGNANLKTDGLNFPNNAPGLYIAPNSNNLVVIMNTFSTINEEITIPDIPLNKWVNVIIRCQGTTIDIYVNGTIIRSLQLPDVPKQNYGDVYVAMNGGFNGNISNLWYYNRALGMSEIQRITSNGPNRKLLGINGINDKKTDYLSLRWFFSGNSDMYNPTDAVIS